MAVRLADHAVPNFRPGDSLSNGKDVRFSLEDGTELASACDTWDPQGESVYWVLVPELVPNMRLRMHVGKAWDAGYETPSDVWSGYAGVWHLNETQGADASIAEATEHGITGTGGPNSISTVDGVFGRARGTRTSGNKKPIFETRYDAALDAGTAFTVSGWIRSAGKSDWCYLVSRKNNDYFEGWGFQMGGDNSRTSPRFYFTGERDKCTGTGGKFFLSTNEWIKFDATYNMSNVAFYANGKLLGTGYSKVYTQAVQGTMGLAGGGLSNDHGTLNGDLDEIRYISGVRSAAWIATEYENQRRDSSFIRWERDAAWKDDVSDLREKLTFTVQGMVASAELTNFPVLVRLRDDLGGGFSYRDMRADGKDMSFALEDGTYLPHEVDTWNTNGYSYVWVRLPVARNGVTFCLRYGGQPRGFDASYVWDGYAGVWHLNEKSGTAAGAVADATTNRIVTTGGNYSILTADGVFGGARGTRKTGNNGTVFTTDYDAALDVGTSFTVSGWIRSAGATSWAYLASRKATDSTAAWGVQFRGENSRACPGFWASASVKGAGSTFFLTTNEWIKFDAVFDANNVAFYANGALLGSTTLATLPEHGTLGLRIGGLTGGHGTFNGDMDEIRYIGKARSAAWAAAEYRTMAAPEEFLYANYGVTDVLNVKVFEKCVPIRLAGYEGTSTLTNFPVLVRISEALIPGFSYAETKGLGGVRFTDGNLNLLTFECEEWNEAGESRFWVSVPELSGTETMIRFYYGKREGKRQGGAENAWKTWTKAGFAGVFHMDVSSGYAIRDTVNGAIGTVVAPTNSMPGAAGLVGGAYQNPVWHTGDRGIKLAPDENGYGVIRSALTNAAVCTFSAWVKNEGGAGNGKDPNYGHIFHQDRYGVKTATEAGDRWNNRFEACLEGSSTKFTIRDYGGEFGNKSCASLAGDWHLFVLSYAGSKRRVYVDGEEMMALASDAAGYVPSETYNFLIGKNGDGTGGGAANAQWVGGIDEVRFRTDATATDWMKAEVANVKAGTLLSYGSAQKSAPSFVLYLK